MKKIVKQAAKKVQEEPLEILKTAKKQVAASEGSLPEASADQERNSGQTEISPEEKEKIEVQGQRMREALEKEMEDIRRQKKQKEEEEEKQEVLEKQKQMEEEKEARGMPIGVPGKPSRKAPVGMKGKLSKLKRKAEIRMPPSG